MNFSNLKTVRISPTASYKVIADYFPRFKNEPPASQSLMNLKELTIHAGALCLYASTLITKIYETSPEDIKLKSNEREINIQNYLKTSNKYAHLSNEEIKIKAHEMLLKDIRNSFAHGNFKIKYDLNKRKIFFILSPQRKDIIIDTPIAISAESLIDANKKFVAKIGNNLLGLNSQDMLDNVQNNLSQLLKTILLPTELLKIVDDYFDNSQKSTTKRVINEKRYFLLQYILQATQAIYDENDYYHIFGKNSNIFERISLIRNSIAHDNFCFADLSRNIQYTDRERSLNETLEKSVASLLTANELKEIIITNLQQGHSEESVKDLTDRLKECFSLLFEDENELTEFDFDE